MYKWPFASWLALGSFALGVLAAGAWGWDGASLAWLALLATALTLGSYVLRALAPWQAFNWLLWLGVVALALGFGRYAWVAGVDGEPWGPRVGEEVNFEAVVASEPDERIDHTRLTARPLDGEFKVLLVAPREPKFNYGDRLAVQGELVEPENFVTDTGREFDYVGYLAKDDIFHLIYQPELKLLARGEGNLVIEKLLALKGWFTTGLALTLPEPHGSLAAGLTVGARRGLSEEWLAALRRTGIIHIVVLSGYNLTIVAEALIRLFTFAPFFWRFGLGVVGIWLFALMTGAGASVMRASLMATIALVARVTGRVYHATTALGVAAALMIWWEPRILIWDVGFQLSILATFGLIHGTPKLAPYFRWLRWPASPRASLGGSWLRELAAATAATQIFVLPWLLYQIGELSLVALPVNLLVVALVPATMLATFLAGTVAGVSTVLAWPFSAAAYLLLTYELAVVRFFNWLPLAAISIPYFPFLAVLLAYAAIYRWWFGRRKIKVKI